MAILEKLGSLLMSALTWVVQFLPDSPFQLINNSDVQSFMGTLNWILPIGQMVAELQLWISAVAVYYIYQIVLRWIRAID
ncbi:hypothetical protein [Ruminiclostridium cellulolyticum]|uniref:Uncharacterized protein n=1 Tax=Ruminiclostridium cellulolyticum (strain ATCC 35319 / DSM 5812 / JCM 6584 / H10) TaxID=394503 RepID=B8I2D0_RUMCH|nr:hypothetical protein [Ruminiclostridium cellulolyticum]ACL75923.1 hypothetical protein Ccel_1571 [Ruminiclostridium cellulolyticum H10]ACL75934.1 hypothetical protein Ccel_1582 [Ruminiclostridium cellulolyticum H10]ACL75945.1 hypothetical protein Ccel_1593 [Ruminiclostridium cellulolyticum H10]